MLLEVEHLYITAEMSRGTNVIVSDLSFSLDKGERLAVVGESGCGKTMTAMAITGLLPRNCKRAGKILFDGTDLVSARERDLRALRGKDVVLVPQSGGEFLNPSLTVGTQLAECLKKAGFKGIKERRELALARLRDAGLDDAENAIGKYPFQLSGGQAQKVVLAAALCGNPRLVIADEPTKGIDEAGAMKFIDGLNELFPSAAVLVITHNVSVAKKCSRVLVMYKGELMEYGDTGKVLSAPSHPYTRSLTEALPENGFRPCPVLREGGTGCAFYRRCPLATEECAAAKPSPEECDGVTRRCFNADGR